MMYIILNLDSLFDIKFIFIFDIYLYILFIINFDILFDIISIIYIWSKSGISYWNLEFKVDIFVVEVRFFFSSLDLIFNYRVEGSLELVYIGRGPWFFFIGVHK